MALYLHKVQQISEDHCGPAVLQMLLGIVGVDVTQEAITQAAEAEATIKEHGVRIDQLVLATTRVAPALVFWYKEHTSLEDIDYIHRHGYVVGVEWQSLFNESEAQDTPGKDYGHFSIVYRLDHTKQVVVMSDPYKEYIDDDREFPFEFFLRRWWDTNEVIDQVTGEKKEVKDEQAAFLVLPAGENFPEQVGFQAFSSPQLDQTNDYTASSAALKLKKIQGLLKGRLRKLQ